MTRKYNFNCNDSLDICQRNSNIKYSNVFNSAFNQKTSRSNNNNQSEVYSSQNLAARVENSKYFDPITLFTQDYPKGLVILGLVDSGSQISLISEQLFKRLKLNEDCSDKIYISDLSQSKTESCPIICDINYRGIKWPCKFYIVDKLKDVVKSHILIGWDIIDNIRNMVGNFDFPTEKYYLPPRTYGKGILPKLVPNNEKVLRDFRETQGDFFKTARKNNISISRVYKIIMNSGDYLGESPYIFMNRINPDWFSEVLDHYNDLTDSIVIMHRADPLENPDYRSDFKVIEKAREPTKAPISEILDYFEEVSNFDDVADKFDITDDQIIDTLKAAKGIREDESLINYILKVQQRDTPNIFNIYYDRIATIKPTESVFKISKEKVKAAGKKVKEKASVAKEKVGEKAVIAKKVAEKKAGKAKSGLKNIQSGLGKGDKYYMNLDFLDSEKTWTMEEVSDKIIETLEGLQDDYKEQVKNLNPYNQKNNILAYEKLLDNLVKEFKPKKLGNKITMALPPEKDSKGKAFFTKTMIDKMARIGSGTFSKEYRVNSTRVRPYWRSKVDIYITVNSSGMLKIKLETTAHPNHLNMSTTKTNELADVINSLFINQ